MSKENFHFNYWNSNIDTKNLSDNLQVDKFDLNKEKEFYLSPEQTYAYKKMGELTGKKVLEIGCGIGVNAIIMAQKGAEVTVIDISPARLNTFAAILKKLNIDNIKLIEASAEKLPFEEDYFDIIYTKSVLIHTDLKQASLEIKRVLKNGGIGVFVEPMDMNPFVLVYRKFFAPKEWKVITNYFTPRRFEIIGSNFAISGGKHFFFISFLAFFWQFYKQDVSKFKYWVKILNSLDESLYKVFPFLKRLSWFRVFWVTKK